MDHTTNKIQKIPLQELKKVNTQDELEAFLLNGPTFTKEQLKVIEDNRKAINKWRTK